MAESLQTSDNEASGAKSAAYLRPMKLLHVGLGPLGIKILRDFVDRDLGEIVAAVDIDPSLAGKPLSALHPSLPKGVRVLTGLDAVRDWAAIDAAMVTTASDLAACAQSLRPILQRGLPVVTTCEEAVWPWLRHRALADELHALCLQHGGRVLGTGVNPGYLMDTVPVFATAVSKRVDKLEIHRIQDATTRRIPFQKKIGATLDDRAFKAGIKAGWLRHVGLGESLHFVAAAMGWPIDRWSENIKPVKAARAMRCGLGPIAKGRAAGVRQEASGYSGGKRVLHFVFQAAIGQKDPHDRVIVSGEPDLDLRFEGGVHGDVATSSIALNALRPLSNAAPGLHTMMSIPMVRWVR